MHDAAAEFALLHKRCSIIVTVAVYWTPSLPQVPVQTLTVLLPEFLYSQCEFLYNPLALTTG